MPDAAIIIACAKIQVSPIEGGAIRPVNDGEYR
jgi:hypothetical protein